MAHANRPTRTRATCDHPYSRKRAGLHIALTTLMCAMSCAHAEDGVTAQRVETVTVTARAAPVLEVENTQIGGFQAPLAKTPQSISVLSSDLLNASATKTLSQAAKLDASLTDNYNAAGYIESLSVRGFTLDQAANFRRNGLATSNYQPIALENKASIEVLKGVAGLQSGISAPGGLLNFVTKQPLAQNATSLAIDTDQFGTAKAHLDHSARVGGVGLRVNLASEKLGSAADRAAGRRTLASAALAAELSAATAIAAEIDVHRKSQPSVPGVGLLDVDGDGIAETLPRNIRPRLNLNNQIWSLPVDSNSVNATASLNHRLNDRWGATLALSHFNSRIDDRVAFPDGCSTAANYVYPGLCANGDVDIYDFRSDGERRRVSSAQAALRGRLEAMQAQHDVRLELATRDGRTRMQPRSAYNFVGTTNVDAPIALQADPSLTSVNTNSADRTTELTFSAKSTWSSFIQSFAGVRLSRAHRESIRTDGAGAVAFNESTATPWLGVAVNPTPQVMAYVSWGQGVELDAVPNRPAEFTNFGAALRALKSEQWEIGTKWQPMPRLTFSAAAFTIEKPYADDRIEASGLRTRIAGGKRARHRGLEAGVVGRINESLSIQASATYLDARFIRAINDGEINRRVNNVPHLAATVFADYKIAAVPGLSVNTLVWHQRGKTATADGRTVLPAAAQIDIGAALQTRVFGQAVTTRIHVENATDRRYWREAPTTSWGGIYLFPSTARTVRLSFTWDQ